MQAAGAPYSDFTHIISADNEMTPHLGISAQEVYFLEHLFAAVAVTKVFVVGNSFGWSTFAIAMLAPQAQVTAIELAGEPFTAKWLDRTNQIAAEEALNVRVYKGSSPQDVAAVVARGGGGPFDLFFIDGQHTNEQIILDCRAAFAHACESTVFLLHDVLMHNMVQGVDQFARESGWNMHLLWRTTSGMALLCRDSRHTALSPLLNAFGESDDHHLLARVRQAQQQQERRSPPQPPTNPAVTFTMVR
jgi:predicted O-methyltransferase YrrM